MVWLEEAKKLMTLAQCVCYFWPNFLRAACRCSCCWKHDVSRICRVCVGQPGRAVSIPLGRSLRWVCLFWGFLLTCIEVLKTESESLTCSMWEGGDLCCASMDIYKQREGVFETDLKRNQSDWFICLQRHNREEPTQQHQKDNWSQKSLWCLWVGLGSVFGVSRLAYPGVVLMLGGCWCVGSSAVWGWMERGAGKCSVSDGSGQVHWFRFCSLGTFWGLS